MLKYYDKLFVRIYYQYVAWKDEGSPDLTAILLISLFQAFNIIAVIFLGGSILWGRNWVFPKLGLIGVGLAALAFDYIRIYHVIGFKKFVDRYHTPESRKLRLHPVPYVIISLLILLVSRLLGLYPDIQ